MGNPRDNAADFLMPAAWKETTEEHKRRNRPKPEGEAVGRSDLDAIEDWLAKGVVDVTKIGDGVRRIVAAGVLMMEAGLTQRAVCLLIQDRLPKKSGGGSHGKPLVDLATIAAVLDAIVGLQGHLTSKGKR